MPPTSGLSWPDAPRFVGRSLAWHSPSARADYVLRRCMRRALRSAACLTDGAGFSSLPLVPRRDSCGPLTLLCRAPMSVGGPCGPGCHAPRQSHALCLLLVSPLSPLIACVWFRIARLRAFLSADLMPAPPVALRVSPVVLVYGFWFPSSPRVLSLQRARLGIVNLMAPRVSRRCAPRGRCCCRCLSPSPAHFLELSASQSLLWRWRV
jgi:hypothetical protein